MATTSPAAVSIQTDDMATPSSAGSAAARVFALPELLEQILIRRGRTEMNSVKADIFRHHTIPVPAVSLFTLQSVNTAFQTIIVRSATLKQLMGLSPTSDNTDMERSRIWAHWALHRMGLTLEPPGPNLDHDDSLRARLETSRGERFGLSVPPSSVLKEASKDAPWHRMLLSNSTTPQPLNIQIAAVVDGGICRYYGSIRSHCKTVYTFPAGATVSHLVDAFFSNGDSVAKRIEDMRIESRDEQDKFARSVTDTLQGPQPMQRRSEPTAKKAWHGASGRCIFVHRTTARGPGPKRVLFTFGKADQWIAETLELGVFATPKRQRKACNILQSPSHKTLEDTSRSIAVSTAVPPVL